MELKNDELLVEICYTMHQVKQFENKYEVVDFIFVDDDDDPDFRIITIMIGRKI